MQSIDEERAMLAGEPGPVRRWAISYQIAVGEFFDAADPRGIDFAVYRRLGQSDQIAALEWRAIEALTAFGVLMTDTRINYQTIMAPIRGEHMAYGDAGFVIYSNSVLGARSNFEAGRRLWRRG